MNMEDEDSFIIPPSPATSHHSLDPYDQDVVHELDTNENSGQKAGSSKRPHSGKQKDAIWAFFTEVKFEGNGKTMTMQRCDSCCQNVSCKVERLKAHQAKCKGPGTSIATDSESSASCSSEMSPGTPRKQLKMDAFLQKTSGEKKEELDSLAAKFWFSANLSFNAANLKTWKTFCSAMRPSYEPPSADQLQGTLLNKTFDELYDKMKEELNGKSGAVVQDGWSDIHNSPTLTHTVVCDGDAYLLNSIECKAETKSAEYCADRFVEAVTLAQEYGFKVIGGTTDNCNVMILMREILKERLPNLLFFGCSPHMLNKLCEDITPNILIAKINEVSKFFKEHHKPSALLKDKQGLIPQLPGTTRWISHLECIRIYLANRTKYIEISQVDGICNGTVTETVNSFTICKNAKDLLVQMEEISGEMLKLQSDSSNIADACHSWLKLLQSESLKPYRRNIKARMATAIEDFFFVAYFFHPKYQGEYMSEKHREKCFQTLLDTNPEWVPFAHAFLAKNPTVYPRSSLNQVVMSGSHPVDWWTSVLKSSSQIPKEFVEYLLPMYRCPASTASVERIFSTFGFVQTDHRNRLTQEKVAKLSFCFRALRKDEAVQRRPRNLLSTKNPE